MSTFGPEFIPKRDGKRLDDQRECILAYMLGHGQWMTPEEIVAHFAALGKRYPCRSVAAQLRHLRKPMFGGYYVPRRKRTVNGRKQNFSEYRVFPNVRTQHQATMFAEKENAWTF